MEERLVHREKARNPMLVTLQGMFIEGNKLHPSKELSPIVVKLLGRMIVVILLQSRNA